MKKTIVYFCASIIAIALLAGCGNKDAYMAGNAQQIDSIAVFTLQKGPVSKRTVIPRGIAHRGIKR